ncbi:MAG: creatininase family protein [Mycobacterium sp.]
MAMNDARERFQERGFRMGETSAAEIRMKYLSSPAIRDAIQSGCRTVVLPCGAIEQHGGHLPLSVDADHASELAVRVAGELNALVAPTIEIGCSEHHMAFAGTLSVSPATLEAWFTDCCTSLARHGFERILIFSAHMGNFDPLSDMADRLYDATPSGVEVVVFSDRALLLDTWRSVVEQHCGRGESVGGHADIAETSIMMALGRGLVHEDALAPGFVGEPDSETLATVFEHGVQALSSNGVLGDPRGASAELGQRCLDAVASILVDTFASSAASSRTGTAAGVLDRT